MFEAVVEGVPSNQQKRNLSFEIVGEGNLPHINILRPSVRNKRGQPLLLYRKQLVGRSQSLPIVLRNEGSLPCKV